MTIVTEVVIMTSFSKNTLTTDQLSGQLFATVAMFLAMFGYFWNHLPNFYSIVS